ncbi:DUF302 domain-containing protein [Sphingomicrobium clamense]|uniref:DUF302 domain-containing protein n=1 Tax=Sphingomicrobium clamense TaxID=2851013 RepID=A0ABS6V766_9SPHN|nr:DUF302 domain-containing protein [Sphingomicrobium sp. B8]MBW0144908.1 DUF302 domain-containing protein [Sphingomicrobium sp. B8]
MIKAVLPLAAVLTLAACAEDSDPFVQESATSNQMTEGEERAGSAVAGFGDGMITRVVDGTVDEAVERLEDALEQKGFNIVAKLDHRANAEKVELELTPATVIFFGKPDVGTPLMKAAPSAALDLPQRMAIYRDAKGEVVVAYNDPRYIATRHNITGEDQRLEKIAEALSSLASIAAGEMPEADDTNSDQDEEN